MALTRREVILAKVETTYGKDVGPVAASDAIFVENLGWSFEGARIIERPAVSSTIGRPQSIYGGSLMQLTFDAELKGSGSAGSAPEIGTLLRGCAMAETINAGTSVVYAPASTSHESLTIYYYADGLLYKLVGCRGTYTFNGEAGARGLASFTITGHISETGTAQAGAATTITLDANSSSVDDSYNGQTINIIAGTGQGESVTISDYVGSTKIATVSAWGTQPDATSVYEIVGGPIDKTMITPTYDSTTPPSYKAAPLSIGSYNPVTAALTFDMAYTLSMPPDVSHPQGFGPIQITGRDVQGSFNPEVVAISSFDPIADWKAGNTAALDTGVVGPTAGNQWRVQAPVVYYRTPGPGDRDGIRTYELGCGFAESSGDDELSITFT